MQHKSSKFVQVNKTKEEQEALLSIGFKLDKFGADGIRGKETRMAMDKFLEAVGYDPKDGKTPREVLLEAAKQAADEARALSVMGQTVTPKEAFAMKNFASSSFFIPELDQSRNRVLQGRGEGTQSPLDVAKRHLGLSEKKDAPEISKFINQASNSKVDPRKTAWCAAFVNAVLKESGVEGTGKLTARSFLNYGVKTKDPKAGDIVVLKRGQEAWQGHVGFVVDRYKQGGQWMVNVLGGNQDAEGRVSVKTFSEKDLLGYRKIPDSGRRMAENTQSSPAVSRRNHSALSSAPSV